MDGKKNIHDLNEEGKKCLELKIVTMMIKMNSSVSKSTVDVKNIKQNICNRWQKKGSRDIREKIRIL